MRGRPGSVRSLEELGRVRLSASFFMRDFLHSEIADFHGIPNIPDEASGTVTGDLRAAGDPLCLPRTRGQRVRQPSRAQLRFEPAQLRPPHLGPSRCRRRVHLCCPRSAWSV